MTETDQRVHPRAQYFLIKDAGQAVPIYAFRDPDDLYAIPGLVVDISAGGVQVLTADTDELSQAIYNLELVVNLSSDAQAEVAEVRKVWSQAEGVNVRTGFVFSQSVETDAKWSEVLRDVPHHLVRCVLHPV